MNVIIGTVVIKMSSEQLREGEELEFTPIPPDISNLMLKACGDVVDVNSGELLKFDGQIREGILVRQCTVHYMPEQAKVIVKIT